MKNETHIKRVALYRHYDEHSILLYVGISLSAIHRLSQHRVTSTWISSAVRMETVWFDTREEAKAAEKKAIQIEKPIHNVQYNKSLFIKENSLNSETFLSVVLPKWLKDEIRIRAAVKSVNISEFIRGCLKREVQSQPNQNHPAN